MSRNQKTYDIFVGNLPKDATDKVVGKLFSRLGEIAAVIVRDSNQAAAPGSKIAYVKFLCDGDAEKAANEMNGFNHEGKKLLVRRSESRKRGSAGNEGGISGSNSSSGSSTPACGFSGGNMSPGVFTGGNLPMGGFNTGNTYCGGYSNVGEPRNITKGPDVLPINAFDLTTESNIKPLSKKNIIEEVTPNALATVNILGTFVESPGTLWGQIVSEENKEKLTELTQELQKLCPAAPPVAKPDRNKVYGALYSEDGIWYRCCVKHTAPEQIKIQYIDYGNSEQVTPGSLVELPSAISSAKGFAQKYVLHNFKPKDMNDKNGIEFLRGYTEGRVLMVQPVKAISGGGFFSIIHHFLDDNTLGDNLSDLLIKKGFGDQKSGYGAKGSGDQSPKVSGEAQSSQNLQITFNKGSQERQVDKGKKDSTDGDRKRDDRERQLKVELNNLRREIEQVKNDKDLVVMELANAKSKIKTLQTDNMALTTKITNSTLSKKIKAVVGLAKKVAKLRAHFPRSQQSLLEQSIHLSTGSGKIHTSSISSLSSVSSALNTYRAAQKEIIQCSDNNELELLIKARDDARILLHQKLVICLAELNSLPMEERKETLKDTDQLLQKSYASYLSPTVHACPKLCDLESAFKEWIQRKKREFEEVRSFTDETQVAVTTALCTLQKALALSTDEGEDVFKDFGDIDQYMMRYAQTLQTEINVTDLEHNKESSFVVNLLFALKQEIASELNIIENMVLMRDEFEDMKNNNEPWLYKHPDLDKLTELKKPLRSLKSKLRHSLADKEDALESDGNQNEEMELIISEINSLQKDIHSILVEEDNIILELSRISEDHFPELKVQHPGFDMNLKYSGLLKTNREIDYYLLTPTSTAGLSTSVFNGEPVFIREFLIGDEQATKDELIQRTIGFNQQCQHLQNIQGIFLSKSGRQIYIQTPNENYKTLEKLVSENVLSDRDKQKILRGIADALNVLHSQEYIHGELNPRNVLVSSDNNAILLEPDLSKCAKERWMKINFTSPNGLTFTPPEHIEYVTTSADMYCFGILALWLHYPHSYFEMKSNLTPDISGIFMDIQLGKMIQNLIFGAPEVRLKADRLLQSEYMTMEIRERKIKKLKTEHTKETAETVQVPDPCSPSHPDVVPVASDLVVEKSDNAMDNETGDITSTATDNNCDNNIVTSSGDDQEDSFESVDNGSDSKAGTTESDTCVQVKCETPSADDSDNVESDRNSSDQDKDGSSDEMISEKQETISE